MDSEIQHWRSPASQEALAIAGPSVLGRAAVKVAKVATVKRASLEKLNMIENE